METQTPPEMEQPKPLDEPKTEPKEEVKVASIIPLDESKAIAPRDQSELARFITHIAKGGAFPARFDTLAKQIAAYTMANQLMPGRWMLAINNIAFIKEQMMIFGELPGAIAEQTKEVEEKKVFVIDKNYNQISAMNKNLGEPIWAAVCLVKRKGREPKEFFYTVDEATTAGQLPAGPHSPWTKHLKIMLMRKAMAQAIKFEFPDAMVGCPIAEYESHVAPDLSDEREVGGKLADELNETYS